MFAAVMTLALNGSIATPSIMSLSLRPSGGPSVSGTSSVAPTVPAQAEDAAAPMLFCQTVNSSASMRPSWLVSISLKRSRMIWSRRAWTIASSSASVTRPSRLVSAAANMAVTALSN